MFASRLFSSVVGGIAYALMLNVIKLRFSLRYITDFAVGDLLSFAYPKESKQRKRYPTKLLFLIPIKFF
ncbi:hypothetical protein EIA51_07195 [Avibacterium paragallinarum]|nr:hypothetical protein EIA51_07195 [Avibacterium paragallinarum]